MENAEGKKYYKLGTIFTIIVCVIALIIGIGFMQGASFAFWILAVVNFITGPLCLILYLREVKRGVFSGSDDD